MTKFLHKSLSDSILKIYYEVYNELGYGFLEKVYQNAMYFELKSQGFKVETQKQIKVYYKSQMVGEYFADLVVNQCVIVELKCGVSLIPAHEAQLINYLKATGVEVGLLLNFGARPQVKRKVYTHQI